MATHVTKKKETQPNTATEKKDNDRETKTINVLCNTSILLMAMITEAVSEIFNNLSKEMITALTTSLGGTENNAKDDLQKSTPDYLRKELMTMKLDLIKQFNEKRKDFGPLLSDPRFDTGIVIIERTSLPLPPLTQELDERSLLGYLALLQTNDPQVTTMFKELFEWMNTLPQPEKKEE